MAFVVDDCCGFIKLRIGCFIIGYINLACTMYLMFKCVFSIVNGNDLMHQNPSIPHNDAWSLGRIIVFMYSIILVGSILELIFTILLLVGLYQYRRSFVNAHFIFNFIFLIFFAIGFSITYFRSFGNIDMKMLISDIFTICVTIYFLLVIRSYYIEMGKEVKPDKEGETS